MPASAELIRCLAGAAICAIPVSLSSLYQDARTERDRPDAVVVVVVVVVVVAAAAAAADDDDDDVEAVVVFVFVEHGGPKAHC